MESESAEFKPGLLVAFDWWSHYKAPAATRDENGNIEWFEIFPDDTGMVVQSVPNNHGNVFEYIVLFSRLDKLIYVRGTMLRPLFGPESLRPPDDKVPK